LDDLVGKIDDLWQAELVALVDIGRTGEREQEEGGCPSPALTLGPVAVTSGAPDHIVVGQHPGSRCADGVGGSQ
jgi:hypothetical protein